MRGLLDTLFWLGTVVSVMLSWAAYVSLGHNALTNAFIVAAFALCMYMLSENVDEEV